MIVSEIINNFSQASRSLLLLDYDGTLVNFSSAKTGADPSERLMDCLSKLASHRKVQVVIITGRGHKDIESKLGNLAIDIVAEHGAMIRKGGFWESRLHEDTSWKQEFLPMLERISGDCPGSFVDEKPFSITWHYRNADPEKGRVVSRQIIRNLEKELPTRDLRFIDGNRVLEILSNNTSKGIAALHLLSGGHYDFVLAVGDDKTDEDMFRVLAGNPACYSLKVGSGPTHARHYIENVDAVISLLEKLGCMAGE
jgi:trehalose 6-phosphate synthase/phosphatase